MSNHLNQMLLLLLSAAGGFPATVSAGNTAGVAITQQVSKCTGVVKDQSGEPIIGASVTVKGSKNGAITDLDGNFSLPNVGKGSTILISYIGYKTKEVVWNGQEINTTLQEDSHGLNEVVVVGYGTQKKVNVTGAISMVGSEALENRPVANVTQALQGTVSGLTFSANNNGGQLNNSMSFTIRGTGSIGEGSSDAPLVLIDGIEGDLNSLNPNDIESVSVLKDAASASIYGTRAAFGVLLVTTKSGKSGKVKVNYSGDVRFSTATQLPEMANSLEWANYFNVASRNAGGSNQFSDETLENIKKYMNGEFTDPTKPEYYGTIAGKTDWNAYTASFANTDWFSEFYKKNVPSTQHNLSLSGGTEKFSWLISGGYLHENGLIRHGHDQLKRYTMNSKINAQLASWARVEYATKWTRKNFERPQYLTGLFFHNIARRWPTCPVVDPNGHWMGGMEIEELENGGVYKTFDDSFTQQLNFTFTPLAGWNIHADGALRVNNYKETNASLPIYTYNKDNKPSLRDSGYGTVTKYSDYRFRQDYYAVNVYTDYTRSFGLHNAKVLLGMNYERYNQDSATGSGEQLTTPDFPFLSQTQANKKASDSYWNRATAGYFGRINYDYDGIYLFEFNLRYDGSSRFTSDRRWAWFPSVSAGWNIAKEKFFEPLSNTISTLKLRASWGQLGNTSSTYKSFWDWYPFYQEQGIASVASSWLINGRQQNVAGLPGIVNSSMTWETVETWDIGLDWAAFNNRLTGSFDVYSRTTRNMIGPAPILGSVLGTNAPKTNNCDMRSTGWEFEIGWRDHIGDVKYGAKLNLSDATAKVLTYPYDGKFENQSIYSNYNGKKMGEIWGYETEGIAQTKEQMDEWRKNNNPNWGSNWQAGDIMYRNLVDRVDENGKELDKGVVNSGSGTIGDHGDLKVIGNTTPRYNFGITLNAEYKGFDFSIFFQGVMKRDWMFAEDAAYFWGAQGNMWQSTVFKEHLNYWSEENPNAYYPRPYLSGDIRKNNKTQTRFLQSAAYMRCKNMQIGYSLPHALISRAGLSNCRIYFSCDNMFTITSLSNVFDPEALGGAWGGGKLYPLQRTFSFGVNVSF